jgi:hypothetical protein
MLSFGRNSAPPSARLRRLGQISPGIFGLGRNPSVSCEQPWDRGGDPQSRGDDASQSPGERQFIQFLPDVGRA